MRSIAQRKKKFVPVWWGSRSRYCCYHWRAATHGQQQKAAASQLVAALKQCSKIRDLESGKKLHQDAISAGFHTKNYVAATLIMMYSKCRNMCLAREVFDGIFFKDAVIWTSLISGYVENRQSLVALDLFTTMDCAPDSLTYVAALKACGALASEQESEAKQIWLHKGTTIHNQLKARGFDAQTVVASSLVDMYSKCGSMSCAREVFDSMIIKDVVTWTSLILGYVENGQSLVALDLFDSMDCKPDSVTYIAVLKACTTLATTEKEPRKQFFLEKGISIHGLLGDCGLDSNISVANTLIDMYCKFGNVDLAGDVFNKIASKDVVTWNSILLGYLQNGRSSLALDLFASMDCEPNSLTYVTVLKACGSLAALPAGEHIHARVCKLGLEQDQAVATTIVDFYGKCGCMSRAEEVFNNMLCPDIVSWNALVTGYTSLTDSAQVFGLVKQMQENGLQMNSVTLVCVLTVCSHTGKVQEGMRCFESMLRRSDVRLNLDHYTCMVDMLGRANMIQQALDLVQGIPFEADTITWMTLLGACKRWKNLEVGKVAFDALAASGTTGSGAYVLMSDIYGSTKMNSEDQANG